MTEAGGGNRKHSDDDDLDATLELEDALERLGVAHEAAGSLAGALAQRRRDRSERVARTVSHAVVAATVLLVCVLVWAVALRVPSFDPVSFSSQTVEAIDDDTGLRVRPTIPGIDGPAVTVDDVVPVVGEICVEHPVPVEVTGSKAWERLDVRGFRYVEEAIGTFVTELDPGCSALEFENAIPAAVAAAVIAADRPTVWRLTGGALPTRGGGVLSGWATERVTIVPRD